MLPEFTEAMSELAGLGDFLDDEYQMINEQMAASSQVRVGIRVVVCPCVRVSTQIIVMQY